MHATYVFGGNLLIIIVKKKNKKNIGNPRKSIKKSVCLSAASCTIFYFLSVLMRQIGGNNQNYKHSLVFSRREVLNMGCFRIL